MACRKEMKNMNKGEMITDLEMNKSKWEDRAVHMINLNHQIPTRTPSIYALQASCCSCAVALYLGVYLNTNMELT
jgi:hypothetical protein